MENCLNPVHASFLQKPVVVTAGTEKENVRKIVLYSLSYIVMIIRYR
jgi:hypothetical protein